MARHPKLNLDPSVRAGLGELPNPALTFLSQDAAIRARLARLPDTSRLRPSIQLESKLEPDVRLDAAECRERIVNDFGSRRGREAGSGVPLSPWVGLRGTGSVVRVGRSSYRSEAHVVSRGQWRHVRVALGGEAERASRGSTPGSALLHATASRSAAAPGGYTVEKGTGSNPGSHRLAELYAAPFC